MRLIQELPPASYLVRADRTVAASLRGRPYVRNVVPLLPGMKKVLFTPPSSGSPFRPVVVEAVEEEPGDSIRAHLQAVSDRPVFSSSTGIAVRHSVSLADLDIELLNRFETVYSISPEPTTAALSSERQGVLISQPTVDGSGRLSLPTGNPGYGGFLVSKGINDFSNTKIGIVDTGFNDGTNSHPDFPLVGSPPVPVIEAVVSEPAWGSVGYDRNLHGTVVTSVVTGYVPPGQREDSQGYRYTLGLAPTARVLVDKFLQCDSRTVLAPAMERIKSYNVNVVNMSWNTLGSFGGCNYTPDSREVDSRARSENWLFTISAGNTPEGGDLCPSYVRAPGTAKNGITAGSTMNFTLDWSNTLGPPGDICNWNGQPPDTDARNIPSYSTRRNPSGLIKPDLVAPGTRVTGPVGSYTPRCTPNGIFCNTNIDPLTSVTYGFSAGTSFSAPAVAGAAAVVRKWYSNVQGGNPSPAMTKAMLINGARDLGPFPGIAGARVLNETMLQPIGAPIGNIPGDYQGWGMLNLSRLLGSANSYYFYDQGLRLLPGSGLWQKYLYVVNASRDTRLTLVWTDSPTLMDTQEYRVNNDLDLSVTNGSGTSTWYGNRLANGYSILNPSFNPDTINNVEQVIIPAGTFATGEAFIVAADPRTVMSEGQDFALFIDNAQEPATSLNTLTPCRVLDTRNPDGPYGGPVLSAGVSRTFTFAGTCGIPLSAKSVLINATVTAPTADGTIRLYPGGIVAPLAGVLYYSAGQTRANNSVVALGSNGTISARADQVSGTAHLIVDVNGYFE